MQQFSCNCGAEYEVVENQVPFKGQDPGASKYVLCGSELRWIGPNPQFHLIKHPDQDRD